MRQSLDIPREAFAFRLTIILFLTTVSLAAFGLLAMSHSISEHRIGGCFGVTSEKAVCPELANPIYFASFHINVFNNLLLATLSASTLLLAALILIALLKPDILNIFRFNYVPALSQSETKISTISKILFRKWLSLLEKRDPDAHVLGAGFFPV